MSYSPAAVLFFLQYFLFVALLSFFVLFCLFFVFLFFVFYFLSQWCPDYHSCLSSTTFSSCYQEISFRRFHFVDFFFLDFSSSSVIFRCFSLQKFLEDGKENRRRNPRDHKTAATKIRTWKDIERKKNNNIGWFHVHSDGLVQFSNLFA